MPTPENQLHLYIYIKFKRGDEVMELSRCKHCGEYVALASVNTEDWTYEPIATDDSDSSGKKVIIDG